MALKAKQHCCEETSVHAVEFYIPCNRPATKVVYHQTDDKLYRMCPTCAHHNISRRGGKDMGKYKYTKTATNEEDK